MDNKKVSKKVDRVILDADVMRVLNELLVQAQNHLGDSIKINTKILVNYILKARSAPLTKDELNTLKDANHDVIQELKSAMARVKMLKQQGSKIDLSEILKNLQTPGVNDKSSATKPRGRKKFKKDSDSENSPEFVQPGMNTEA